jgi:hypothetical protein
MLTSTRGSEDFIQLAMQALVDSGVTPSEAMIQAAVKMLARLEDAAPLPEIADAGLAYDAMLRRCSVD